jgi:PAS domain S-box-containing protein
VTLALGVLAIGRVRSARRRRATEDALRRRVRQQQLIALLGPEVLRGLPCEELTRRTLECALEGLAAQSGVVLRLDPGATWLVVEAGAGWRQDAIPVPAGPGSQACYTVQSSGPVITEDMHTEARFSVMPVPAEQGVRSSLSIAVRVPGLPCRLVAVFATAPRSFDAEDASFLAAIGNLLAEGIERQRAGEEIARLLVCQREARADAERTGAYVRRLFENCLDAIVAFDDDGKIHDVNAAACAVFGLAREDLVDHSVTEIATTPARSAGENFAAYLAGEQVGEIEIVRPDGAVRILEYAATRIATGTHVASIRDVTERKRAERRTAVLLGITQDVAGSLERGDILQRVETRLCQGLPCDAMVAWYWDPEGEVYRVISHVGLPPALGADVEAIVFRDGEPIGGALERGPVVVNDMAAQSAIPREMWQRFGLFAEMAAPFRARGRHVGSLAAYHRTPGRTFGPGEVELLMAVASSVSVALEAADLYDAQAKAAELAGLRARFSQELIESLHGGEFLDRLCRTAKDLLDGDESCFIARRPAQDDFVVMASQGAGGDENAVAQALEIPAAAMAPVLAAFGRDDVAQIASGIPGRVTASLRDPVGLGTQLCIALRKGPELAGLLVVQRSGRATPFTMRDKILARSIAHVASLALQHARVVEELHRSSQLKAERFGVFSHEVRTPLNIIVGYQDLLLDGAFGELEAEQQDALRRALASSRALCHLIDNSLDLSRLEAGRLTVEPEDTSIALLLGTLDAETYLLREASGVPLTLTLSPHLGTMFTDPGKLRAALRNLLVNAFKYTDVGSVAVSAVPSDGGVEIAVADTGKGMNPEVVGKLFRPFPREDDADSDRRGIGLGLCVADRMVSLLGGRISVQSEQGHGSTFRVWVPDLRRPRDPPPEMLGQLVNARRRALVPFTGKAA